MSVKLKKHVTPDGLKRRAKRLRYAGRLCASLYHSGPEIHRGSYQMWIKSQRYHAKAHALESLLEETP